MKQKELDKKQLKDVNGGREIQPEILDLGIKDGYDIDGIFHSIGNVAVDPTKECAR